MYGKSWLADIIPAIAEAAGISTWGAGVSLWFCELSLWWDERCWCWSFSVETWVLVCCPITSTWDAVTWVLADWDVEGAFNCAYGCSVGLTFEFFEK